MESGTRVTLRPYLSLLLLVPDDPATGTAHYKDMVKDVNDTQLEPEEILSYNVYYYNRFSGQINIIQ